MKAFIQAVVQKSVEFFQRNVEEVRYTIGGGSIGFIGSAFWKDWAQPVAVTILCAIISLLIGHFGKKVLNRKKDEMNYRSNGRQK